MTTMIDEIHELLSDAFGSDDPNVGPMMKYLERLKEPTEDMITAMYEVENDQGSSAEDILITALKAAEEGL